MGFTVIHGITKENGFNQTEGLTRDTGLTMQPPFVDVGATLLWTEGAEDSFVYNEGSGDRILHEE